MTNLPYIISALLILAGCRLAFGAEVSTAVPHHHPLNGSTAVRTGFTAKPMSDLKLEVRRALGAIGTEVGIHTGAFVANRRP